MEAVSGHGAARLDQARMHLDNAQRSWFGALREWSPRS